MNDRGPTGERSEKTHHEIDGVIRRQNAEVAHARPEGIEGSERDARLQIVLVRYHAAFGASASPRGVDNAGRIPPAARNENRFPCASKLFPALRAGKNSVCRRLGNKNRLTFVAAARPAETLRCRQIGYSVMRTLAPECLRSCQCSSGVSLQSSGTRTPPAKKTA